MTCTVRFVFKKTFFGGTIMREIIIRNIDNAPNGKEFFAGISGNFKNFGQTLCELIDNPISNLSLIHI